jgi:hypothetical protein
VHPIKQFAGGGAVALAVCAISASTGSMLPSDAPTPRSLPSSTTTVDIVARCAEDDPCWTWSRMGNHRRAVLDLASGRRVVVSPCTFRHMWMNGNAALSKRSEQMRGDWWAIHHGCDPAPGQSVYIHPTGLTEVR